MNPPDASLSTPAEITSEIPMSTTPTTSTSKTTDQIPLIAQTDPSNVKGKDREEKPCPCNRVPERSMLRCKTCGGRYHYSCVCFYGGYIEQRPGKFICGTCQPPPPFIPLLSPVLSSPSPVIDDKKVLPLKQDSYNSSSTNNNSKSKHTYSSSQKAGSPPVLLDSRFISAGAGSGSGSGMISGYPGTLVRGGSGSTTHLQSSWDSHSQHHPAHRPPYDPYYSHHPSSSSSQFPPRHDRPWGIDPGHDLYAGYNGPGGARGGLGGGGGGPMGTYPPYGYMGGQFGGSGGGPSWDIHGHHSQQQYPGGVGAGGGAGGRPDMIGNGSGMDWRHPGQVGGGAGAGYPRPSYPHTGASGSANTQGAGNVASGSGSGGGGAAKSASFGDPEKEREREAYLAAEREREKGRRIERAKYKEKQEKQMQEENNSQRQSGDNSTDINSKKLHHKKRKLSPSPVVSASRSRSYTNTNNNSDSDSDSDSSSDDEHPNIKNSSRRRQPKPAQHKKPKITHNALPERSSAAVATPPKKSHKKKIPPVYGPDGVEIIPPPKKSHKKKIPADFVAIPVPVKVIDPADIKYTTVTDDKQSDEVRRECFNCGTRDTPSWRRSILDTTRILCNRCGIYEKVHHQPRPYLEQTEKERRAIGGYTYSVASDRKDAEKEKEKKEARKEARRAKKRENRTGRGSKKTSEELDEEDEMDVDDADDE